MRIPLAPLAFALALASGALPRTATAQAQQHAGHHEMKMDESHAMSGWKELDVFHMVMMETWHPAKKSDDLVPIRARADAMADAAKIWAASTPPTSCNSKAITASVTAVALGAQSLAELVAKQAPDAAVKDALKALHDVFEVAKGGCKPAKQ